MSRDVGAYGWYIAKRIGLSPIWEDDLKQEVRLGVWKAGGDDRPTVIRNIVVDFCRVYGPVSRSGTRRDPTYIDSLEAILPGPGRDRHEEWLDTVNAISRLSPRQKRAIEDKLAGRGQRNDQGNPCTYHLEHARLILREATSVTQGL